MKNAYNLIRKIHLYTAFIIVSFIVMYFITGFMMKHGDWFPQSDAKVFSKKFDLHISKEMNEEEWSIYLQDKFDIHAQRKRSNKNNDGTISFKYSKPGEFSTVTLSADKSVATLRTQHFSAYGTFAGFHRLNGYGGGWLYDIYVFMLDLARIALLVFVVTGLYLWYKLIRKKTWGIIILSASIIYTLIIIALFMNG